MVLTKATALTDTTSTTAIVLNKKLKVNLIMGHLDNNDYSNAAAYGDLSAETQVFTDIHCHCLPGIDDGPREMAEAIELCRALFDDGIKTVIATPHQLGRYGDFNSAADIRQKVSDLNEQLHNESIALTVVPGGDVRVDERLCRLIDDDMILTLADTGEYILLELPHEIFIDIEPLLVDLSDRGIRSIVSHPERHPVLAKKPDLLNKWLRHSSYLQITAGSLVGSFGSTAQKAAWHFLSSGLACLVATDSHNINGRRPCMTAAFDSIKNKLGQSVARSVCIENPLAVLSGKQINSARYCSSR